MGRYRAQKGGVAVHVNPEQFEAFLTLGYTIIEEIVTEAVIAQPNKQMSNQTIDLIKTETNKSQVAMINRTNTTA